MNDTKRPGDTSKPIRPGDVFQMHASYLVVAVRRERRDAGGQRVVRVAGRYESGEAWEHPCLVSCLRAVAS